jgi:hypothetical protein
MNWYLRSFAHDTRLRLLNLISDKNIISLFIFVMPHIFKVWFHLAEDDIFRELQLILDMEMGWLLNRL